jgi:EAL domain-containing protein (putative c-di-GMP-specific phosphodiesterase class I)
MHHDVVTAAKLQRDLRRGMERSEFENHYQEIVSVVGRLAGFECLLRWRHPDRGLLAPGEFLEVAEETGILLDIGWWSLKTACHHLAAWRKLPGMEDLTVSVNLSGRQFAQPDIVERLATALGEAGLPGKALKVEITETVIMDNVVVAADEMRRLRALGTGLMIDDFGTGYSSLSRLKDLPIDAIKIDRSFIQALTSAGSASIVKSIIALGTNLGLPVIAEGVETIEQKNALIALGCDYLQGYYVSRPLNAADTKARVIALAQTA